MKLLFFLTSLVTAHAWAATGHGPEGVPTTGIFWQVVNLGIVCGIIFWATRKQIPEFFRQRQEGFVASAKKAELAKAEAEKQYADIKHKLAHLRDTYQESLARAQAEAVEMRKQLLGDAQEQARRIKDEADTSVKIELQKAQRDLHEKFVHETIGLARQALAKDIGSADHQKLQTEFTKNIEAVHP